MTANRTKLRWLIWPRQHGKTFEVIKWWLEDPENRVIVTASEQLAQYKREEIQSEADKYRPKFSQQFLKGHIVPYSTWASAQRGRAPAEVALDDCVKAILREFAGRQNTLAIISDAGTVESPGPAHLKRIKRNLELMDQWGYDWRNEE